MKIAYIDGPRLRRAIMAGSRSIIANTEALNAINVFPVPDGDTGTNMASTARSIAASLREHPFRDAGSVLRQAAHSALAGARGNSGAILAQFFQSLAHELGQDARIGAKRLAQAAVTAAMRTRAALTLPREGTILTVLRDWADALHTAAAHTDDIFHVFLSGLEAAKASLEGTRNTLPEMRRAGVVDAGAKGFVHLLEGMAELLKPGSKNRMALAPASTGGISVLADSPFAISELRSSVDSGEPGGPRYCTEALVSEASISLEAMRETLAGLGDSIVVAGDESFARVHIHSDRPSAVFDFLESAGSVEQHKVDDMELQRRLADRPRSPGGKKTCAIVVDTGCDLPEDFLLEHRVIKVPALITIGGVTRPDGPAMDRAAVIGTMTRDPEFSMSTSQPSDASFARAFQLALWQAEEAVYIGLSSALSGTFQAGRKAAERFGGRIRCFDSKTVTAGVGSLAAYACMLAEAGDPGTAIVEKLEEARGRMEMFVAVKDLKSLIRSGRLHGLKSLVLRKFGLRPILGTNREGKATSRGVYLGEDKAVQTLFGKMRGIIAKGKALRLHIVHVAAKEEAEKLAKLCRAVADQETDIIVSDMGPLLASIGWLGAIGIAAIR